MDYFGDVSGTLRSLIEGDCDVCVVAVIGGDPIDCSRCAKRAVRKIEDIPEAKWHDLTRVQKRRFFDCLSDQELQFGYTVFDLDRLHTMENYHLLY